MMTECFPFWGHTQLVIPPKASLRIASFRPLSSGTVLSGESALLTLLSEKVSLVSGVLTSTSCLCYCPHHTGQCKTAGVLVLFNALEPVDF